MPSWIRVQPIKQRILIRHASPEDREITEEIILKNSGKEDIVDFPIPLADFLHGITIWDEDDSKLPFYSRQQMNLIIKDYEPAIKEKLRKQINEGALVWIRLSEDKPLRPNQLRTVRLTFAGTNETNPKKGVIAFSMFDKKTYVDYLAQSMPIETGYFITAPKGFSLEIVREKTSLCSLGGSHDDIIPIKNINPTAPDSGVDFEEMRVFVYTVPESYISIFLVPPSVTTTLTLDGCCYKGKFIEVTGQLTEAIQGNGIESMPITLSINHINGQRESLKTFTKGDGVFSFSLDAHSWDAECKVKAYFDDNSYYVAAFSEEKTIATPSNSPKNNNSDYAAPPNTSGKGDKGPPVYAFRLEYEVKLPRSERCIWTLVILSLSIFLLLLLMPYLAEAINNKEGINLYYGIKIPTSQKFFKAHAISDVTIVGIIALAGASVGSMVATNNPLLKRTTIIAFILALIIALLGSYSLISFPSVNAR